MSLPQKVSLEAALGAAEAPLGGWASEALVAQFPGPAFCATADGRILAASPAAEPLIAAFEASGDAALAALVKWVALERRPRTDRLRVPGGDGEHVFDIALLPVPQPDGQLHVLLVGHNVTAESRFTSALVASRQLYKDLVSCSSDFAWECKADGRFSLTTPSQALGYRPGSLEGISARDLLHPDSETKGQLPFETAAPVADVELWLRTVHGDRACVLVSAVPVFGRDGSWQGARGVCRDVTEARLREAELDQAQRRDRLIQDVVDSTRNELIPDAMLHAAARSMARAMNARHSWIFRVDPQGEMKLAANTDGTPELPADIAPDLEELFAGDGPPEAHDLIVNGYALLASVCLFRKAPKGYVCVARNLNDPSWSVVSRELLIGVAPHIGIAIAQADIQDKLNYLSRVDELTGLYNRRAFAEEVDRRLRYAKRMGRAGALLYIDLDNFKSVNDRKGHEAGDALLVAMAKLLRDSSRSGDLAARLGGDEFALWLEDTGRDGTLGKARLLLDGFKAIAAELDCPGAPLGLSIGAASVQVGQFVAFEALVGAADQAMYRVKHTGKGAIAVADEERLG